MSPKNISLSILAIAVFSAYSLYERVHQDSAALAALIMNDLAGRASGDLAATNPDPVVAPQQPTPTAQPTTQQVSQQAYQHYLQQLNARTEDSEREEEGDTEDDGIRRRSVTANAPAPTQTTTPTPARTQTQPAQQTTPTQPVARSSGAFKDGSYTGPSVNVYYGYVQVKAIISGGKLTDVTFLSYPNDRGTSRQINAQAMPILTQEAISAQSAQVSGVSGASETSRGFIESLGSALSQAHV